uniref:Uracil phosphoribosyltransferase or UMP pyrophosphorylase n=1 Tax=Eucheuma denticulatum TaxID=305493 RepID=A0A8E7PHP6_9FLOR|nr:uracil phosphoribosyltransferase or UMP pyrophosphorylase [Eucheuma denticulatum]
MQLNVYLISHPIIHKLSTQLMYFTKNKNNINAQTYNGLNLFLIYETLRKLVRTKTIYMKNIDYIEETSMFNPQESYLLLTNIENCSDIITYLKNIIPKLSLIHINLNKKQYINKNYLSESIINIANNQKIIIMENFLDSNSIIQLIEYLIYNIKIKDNKIKIICITCTNNILEIINNKYPLLEIYTTKIINS